MDILTTFVFWLIPATIYFGPSVVAVCRNHYRARYILAFNVLFGWTIVGLFVAFAWALSATRRSGVDPVDEEPTDFGERMFRNRNVVAQPDGGAIVYPGFLAEDAFWLGATDFKKYLQMRAEETRRNFPRGLIILLSGAGMFLGFRHWIGPEHGTAPAIVMFTAIVLFVAAWDLVLRPRRAFVSAFPKAPRAKDPIRKQRKILAGLVAFDPVICVGATILCSGLIASLTAAYFLGTRSVTLHARDAAIVLLGFAILSGGAAFYGHLAWHHVRFLLQHRRTATQQDLDALGTGVKPPPTAHSGKPADMPFARSMTAPSDTGSAGALRLRLREG